MPDTAGERPTGGTLAAAITTATVRIMGEYTGRGPTKARTYIDDDMIIVLLQDAMTKGERTLLNAGEADFVLETRHRFQETMREDLVAAIEILSERTVRAFMSGNHVGPDIAAEIFILEPLSDEPA